MSEFADLTGLRTLVTGSSSGIGRAIATEFARAGADVIVHCRYSVEPAEFLVHEIRQLGRRAALEVSDLSDPAALSEFAHRAWQHLGGLDVCVNNAGADLLTGDGARLDYADKLERVLAVDVRATMLLSRDLGRRMQSAGAGTIINIGWDQAATGMEGDSGELFAASKSAVMAFTRSLALTLAPQVRVNCIAPGWIQTAWGKGASDAWQQRVLDETPLKRWGTPEDIAAAARFLAARDSAYITGQVLNINGGAVRG
jgi:3-oxoacyl-[acyl-carrier protein] reductase